MWGTWPDLWRGGGNHYYYCHRLPITFSTRSMKIEATPLGAKNPAEIILWVTCKSGPGGARFLVMIPSENAEIFRGW